MEPLSQLRREEIIFFFFFLKCEVSGKWSLAWKYTSALSQDTIDPCFVGAALEFEADLGFGQQRAGLYSFLYSFAVFVYCIFPVHDITFISSLSNSLEIFSNLLNE